MAAASLLTSAALPPPPGLDIGQNLGAPKKCAAYPDVRLPDGSGLRTYAAHGYLSHAVPMHLELTKFNIGYNFPSTGSFDNDASTEDEGPRRITKCSVDSLLASGDDFPPQTPGKLPPKGKGGKSRPMKSLSVRAAPFVPCSGGNTQPEMEGAVSKKEWHAAAKTVGHVSECGHIFMYAPGPKRKRMSDKGEVFELSRLVTLSDCQHVQGGQHDYAFAVMGGQLGRADGAGFTFDTMLRRRSIKEMRAIFFNQWGTICLRNNNHIDKLPFQLPRLQVGTQLNLHVDLKRGVVSFTMQHGYQSTGFAEVYLEQYWEDYKEVCVGGGFFCAVVSGECSVSLH